MRQDYTLCWCLYICCSGAHCNFSVLAHYNKNRFATVLHTRDIELFLVAVLYLYVHAREYLGIGMIWVFLLLFFLWAPIWCLLVYGRLMSGSKFGEDGEIECCLNASRGTLSKIYIKWLVNYCIFVCIRWV